MTKDRTKVSSLPDETNRTESGKRDVGTAASVDELKRNSGASTPQPNTRTNAEHTTDAGSEGGKT